MDNERSIAMRAQLGGNLVVELVHRQNVSVQQLRLVELQRVGGIRARCHLSRCVMSSPSLRAACIRRSLRVGVALALCCSALLMDGSSQECLEQQHGWRLRAVRRAVVGRLARLAGVLCA
jgi:hypothetical protein